MESYRFARIWNISIQKRAFVFLFIYQYVIYYKNDSFWCSKCTVLKTLQLIASGEMNLFTAAKQKRTSLGLFFCDWLPSVQKWTVKIITWTVKQTGSFTQKVHISLNYSDVMSLIRETIPLVFLFILIAYQSNPLLCWLFIG